MGHLALYRKFRPLVFDDVVGQESVVNTIKNQIDNNSFGHAYLFSGIRGTGKTTIAKIFARSINCLNPNGVNPCNECSICESILNNSSMDIVEMDAASNNSVDDIREINENVNFPPSNSKYKVYIIDEVHMLSKGAFNALLKTLEEPPEYVIFLLATTEPNRIPDTILSRCQRYDLKRVTTNDILKRLKYVLEKLDKDYEESALDIIVTKAQGSVRDSLSILDQCLSYNSDLTYETVVQILGLIEIDKLNDLADSIIEKNSNKGIEIINDIFSKGKDINQFVESFLEHFRNLLIAQMHTKPENLIKVSDKQIEIYKAQAKKFEMTEITRILDIFINLEKDIKFSTSSKILVEMAMFKIFNNDLNVSTETLIQKIKALEEKIELISIEGVKQSSKPINDKKNKKDNEIKYKTTESIESFIGEETKMKIDLDEVLAKWNEVLKILKKVRIKVYAFIIETEPVSVSGNKIILKLDKDYKFHGDNLMKSKNKETVDMILKKVFSKNLTIDVTYEEVIKKNKSENLNVDEQVAGYFSDYDKVLKIEE